MSKSKGPGYPLSFKCSQERKERGFWDYTDRKATHECTPTGRTRKAPSQGKGHPRKALRKLEYNCTCGFTGWSAHIDLARRAVALNLVDPREVLPEYRWAEEIDGSDELRCLTCSMPLVEKGTAVAPEFRCTNEGGCGRVFVPRRESFK